MTNFPTLSQIAKGSRQVQPRIDQELEAKYGCMPQLCRAHKCAYELSCLIFESLESDRGFIIEGRYIQPSVVVLDRDFLGLASPSIQAGGPLLALSFPYQDVMAEDIIRALKKLHEKGLLADRAPLPGELSGAFEERNPEFRSKFSFHEWPLVYVPTLPANPRG